jgi:hypothetical protein
MKRISLKEVKHYLRQRSSDELIRDISDLFKLFDFVKDYYQIKIMPESSEQLVAKHKEMILQEFFPSRGFGKARLSIAKRAITDYKKVSTSVEELADLMLFYVEMGVEYTTTYGDINEEFYSSMEGMYSRVLKLIADNDLHDHFSSRCRQIIDDTSRIGWGFHENLFEAYVDVFS